MHEQRVFPWWFPYWMCAKPVAYVWVLKKYGEARPCPKHQGHAGACWAGNP